jgi:beta-lactamase regulating signal transducer with metallopeptidase domain
MFEALVNWLLTYMVHSTVFLGLAWWAERAGLMRRLGGAHAELAWRWALFGPLLTASWPLLAGWLPQPAPEPMAEPVPVIAAVSRNAPAALQQGPLVVQAPQAELPLDWMPAAAGTATVLWLLGAASALALLSAGALWLGRTVRRLPANTDPQLHAQLEALSRRAALRTPRLRVASRWSSPLLTPGGTICLPRWAESLAPAQREAVLAHELAHLHRRDPAWRVAAQLLVGLAWLQPLNRLALRRLDLLAELACDAWAARLTGSAVPLAESLLHAAEQSPRRNAPRLATAMSATPLAQRLHRLLEENTMNPEKPTNRKTRWAIAAGVLLAAVAVPTVVVHNAGAAVPLPDWLGHFDGFSNMVFHDGSITRIETGGPEGRLKIDIRGPLEFTEAEDDVSSVEGRLEVLDKRSGHTHHLLMQGGDGKPSSRLYERDGQAVTAPDAQDRAWLAEVTELIVQSTVSPDEQVKRLLARGGTEAVLARIQKPHGDNARSALIQALMRSGPQTPATLDRLLAAVSEVRSDFERRSALQAIAGQALAEPQQLVWLQHAAEIGSDFECREALERIAPQLLDSAPVLAAWSIAMKSIGSDFEARSAIATQMAQGKVTAPMVSSALSASLNIGSDFEHRSALEAIARRMDAADTQQAQAYAGSAMRIGSDFERREALVALIKTGALKREGFAAVLDASTSIGSSFETMTVLQEVAAAMPADADLIARYRKVARRLSDFERGQAEKALDHLDPA